MRGSNRLAGMVLLALSGCAVRPTDLAAPTTYRTGHVFHRDGVRLFYLLTGSGSDTIVVLHGGPGLNLEGLRPDLAPLERHHVLLYYDQRGGGRSDLGDTLALTIDAMVEDLEAVRAVFGLEHLAIVGHSWGAGLAVLYAARYPDRVRRLVLIGPMPPRGIPYLEQFEANQAARRDSADLRRLAALDTVADESSRCGELMRLGRRVKAGSPGRAARVQGDFCAGDPDHLGRLPLVMRRLFEPFGTYPTLTYDWRELARGLRIPTLLLHGERDPLPLVSAAEWAAVLPEAQLLSIPDAGHFPQAETPDRFFPPVEEFLRGDRP